MKSISRVLRSRTAQRLAYLLALALVWSGCGGEEEVTNTGVARSTAQRVSISEPVDDEARPEVDRTPPAAVEAFRADIRGWGRVSFSWAPSQGENEDPAALRFTVRGQRGSQLIDSEHEDDVITLQASAGATEHTAVAPLTHTVWQVRATDTAGNQGVFSSALDVLPRPRLYNRFTGAVDGRLSSCTTTTGGGLVCAGERGRYALWREGRWEERLIDSASTLRLIHAPDGAVELVTDLQRHPLDDNGDPHAIEAEWEGEPALPMKRFGYEPSGLSIWLDNQGAVWGGDGDAFIHLPDPLLLGPQDSCGNLVDLVFGDPTSFARCEDGAQFVMTAARDGYRWRRLDEAAGLTAAPRPQRSLQYGTGRQIAMLTWQGDVMLYGMGGWRTVLERGDRPNGVTAITNDGDARDYLVGVRNIVARMNSIGEMTPVATTPFIDPIIYLPAAGRPQHVVSSSGEVFDLETQTLLRAGPPTDFRQVVRRDGGAVGLLSVTPTPTLYLRRQPSWTVYESNDLALQPIAGAEFTAFALGDDGRLLIGADLGEGGGAIFSVDADGRVVQPFLYPVPSRRPPAGATNAQITALSMEIAGSRLNAALNAITPAGEYVPPALEGVPGEALLDRPPTPPPIAAIDVSTASGTAVAVGAGGSLWLGVPGGWLRIQTGVTTPLTAVLVTGEGQYVAGGTDGLVLSCRRDACETVQLAIGDITRLAEHRGRLIAFGTTGTAITDVDGSWTELMLEFPAPHPAGSPPGALLAMESVGDHEWILAADGSVWFGEANQHLAMALVDDPRTLWVDPAGAAIVVSGKKVVRIEPP